MNLKLLNIKWVIGSIYLLLLIAGITFLLSKYNISDFFSYEFIRLNKNVILEYRRENFLILTILFFIFSIVWVLMLGFALPLLIFSGFVFGKWWGILIVLTSTSIGATLLYFLAGLFFRDIIQEKFGPKFLKLKKFFNKNELVYFMFFRFIGGGGDSLCSTKHFANIIRYVYEKLYYCYISWQYTIHVCYSLYR